LAAEANGNPWRLGVARANRGDAVRRLTGLTVAGIGDSGVRSAVPMPGVEYIELRELDRRPLRVTVAPVFSVLAAARDAAGAGRAGTPEAWCRAIRVQFSGRDYETLTPLTTAARVNVPDAILPFPAPPGQSLKDSFERIIAGEESLVRDIHACVSSGRAGDWREPARNPRRWVRRFVITLARAWNGFEPIWRMAQESLAQETERITVAGARGAHQHVLDGLLAHARVTQERWEIDGFADHDIGYAVPTDGLVLMPQVAGPLASAVYHVGPTMSHIGYPLRPLPSDAPMRPASSASLEGLVGIPRARILRELDQPASNIGLAEVLHTAPSTASHHISALEAAGLVTRRRSGRHVMVQRTGRGEALVALYDGG
jgi:DNA-binding transcriptional ArsR family regulator